MKTHTKSFQSAELETTFQKESLTGDRITPLLDSQGGKKDRKTDERSVSLSSSSSKDKGTEDSGLEKGKTLPIEKHSKEALHAMQVNRSERRNT